MSVLPYAYETLEAVTAQEVAGDYLYVNHGKDISSQMKPAVSIELNLDGSITGEATGTWRLVGDYFAHLEIDGVLYKGVFIRQWDPTLAARIMTFTVLSEQGVAAWGKAQN